MKKVAYVLFGLQILALFGAFANGTFPELLANMLFMNGVPGFSQFLGFFLCTWIGLILLSKAKKKEASAPVIFFCPSCHTVYEGTPGQTYGCPSCQIAIVEKNIRNADWEKMSDEERQRWIYSWCQ